MSGLVIGLLVGIFLIFWMFIEIAILFFINKRLALAPFEGEEGSNIKEESKDYASRALILLGIVLAAITLLITAFSNRLAEIEATIIVAMCALGFFLISYMTYGLTGLSRIYWILQDRSLNFGLIAIFLALVTFSFEKFSMLSVPAILFFVIMMIFHLVEYKKDFNYFRQRGESRKK